MIDFDYLYKGLCGLANAHRAGTMAAAWLIRCQRPPNPCLRFDAVAISSPMVTSTICWIDLYARIPNVPNREKRASRRHHQPDHITVNHLWLGLVTPVSAEVGRHLIEGLRNPTVVQDQSALDEFSIRPVGIREAVAKALGASGKTAS